MFKLQQVNQLSYEIPHNKYAKNPWSYAPEFLKVFGDVRIHCGGRATFDCVLLGTPRPKVVAKKKVFYFSAIKKLVLFIFFFLMLISIITFRFVGFLMMKNYASTIL